MRTKTKYSYQFIEAMTYRKFSDVIKKSLEDKSLSDKENMKKKNPLDTFKFEIHPILEMKHKKSMTKKDISRNYWTTPENLLELCKFILDKKPLPEAFNWCNDDVLRWIDKIGYPQYKETFSKNFINGQKLLLLTNPSHLVAMNIKNLEHINAIISSIRKLFDVEKSILNRNIYYPLYNYDTHYKFYRVHTGLKYEKTRHSDLLKRMQLINESPKNLNHWQQLENWLEHRPNRKLQIVANAPRMNLYSVKKPPREIICNKDDENLKIWCDCVPPCECEWKKSDYRPSWKLSILNGNELLSQRSQDSNMESVTVEKKSENEKDHDDEKNDASVKSNTHKTSESCHCMPPCTCDWKAVKHSPSTIGILKKRYSIRYSFGEQSLFTYGTSETETLT